MYHLDTWPQDLNTELNLKDSLFGVLKPTRKPDPDKCSYSGYCIGFDSHPNFLLQKFDWYKSDIIFGVENSSPVIVIIKKYLSYSQRSSTRVR